jgi:hypothetical protein
VPDALKGPVWIDPPKYWAAVEGKSEEEIAQIWDTILQLLQQDQADAVSRIDFVTGIGYPYRRRGCKAA